MRIFGTGLALCIACLCLGVISANAQTFPDIIISGSDVVKVYDGDTITVNIPAYPALIGDSISIRIAGIDTPEIRSKQPCLKAKAQSAKAYVQSMLQKASQVKIANVKRGKYFRIVGEVWIDGVNLGQALIKAKLALPYDGKTKSRWECTN